MPWGIGSGHIGHDHARVHADYHHRKAEMQQHQDELNQHHNVAKAEAEGERHRSWLVVRVLRRLFGRL
jgi:hypothetical protein